MTGKCYQDCTVITDKKVGWRITEIRGYELDVTVAEVIFHVFSMFFVLYKRMWQTEDVEAEHPSREMCIFPNCARFVTHFYFVEIKHYLNVTYVTFIHPTDTHTHTLSRQDSDISKSPLFYFFQSHQHLYCQKLPEFKIICTSHSHI